MECFDEQAGVLVCVQWALVHAFQNLKRYQQGVRNMQARSHMLDHRSSNMVTILMVYYQPPAIVLSVVAKYLSLVRIGPYPSSVLSTVTQQLAPL